MKDMCVTWNISCHAALVKSLLRYHQLNNYASLFLEISTILGRWAEVPLHWCYILKVHVAKSTTCIPLLRVLNQTFTCWMVSPDLLLGCDHRVGNIDEEGEKARNRLRKMMYCQSCISQSCTELFVPQFAVNAAPEAELLVSIETHHLLSVFVAKFNVPLNCRKFCETFFPQCMLWNITSGQEENSSL